MAEEIDDTGDLTGGAYQIPSASDSGSEVFNILETFMKRMAVHKHDGTDALVINKKVDKTVYSAGAVATTGSSSAWVSGTNGNYYMDIKVADSEIQLEDGDGDVNDITREFYYLQDAIDAPATDPDCVLAGGEWGASCTITARSAHVKFNPDVEYLGNSIVRVHTNISATITAASTGVGTIYMKAF